MINKKPLTLDELASIYERSKEYDNDTVTDHIISLGLRRDVLNQTCRTDSDQLRLERINRNYNTARDAYSNKPSDFSLQDSQEMLTYVAQIHLDMLKLEQNQKEYDTDDDE